MPTTVLGLLGVLLCALAVTSQVTPQADFDIKGTLTTISPALEDGVKSLIQRWSPMRHVTEEVEKICFEVKPDIGLDEAVDTHFPDYVPICFRSQIVAGINYLVKVYVGQDVCVHALIFQALPCNGGGLTVTRVQFPKTIRDPLVPF